MASARDLDGSPIDLVSPGNSICRRGNDRNGSWLCENALTEALRRRDFGKVAMHGHFAKISVFLSGRAPDADSGHLGRLCNWRRKHVFDDYALIRARSGWTSMMFMTRVRL